MKTIKGYKFIQKNLKSNNGNHEWGTGQWYKHQGELKLCYSGFHACRTPLQSLDYFGDRWFIVEARGKIKEEENDKFVCSEMRLVKEIPIDKVVQPFAVRCAKRCLKYYEKEYPKDKRVRELIEGIELYLKKKISLKELEKRESAAKSAAKSAATSAWRAWHTAGSTAESACSAASTAASAATSAWRAASAATSAWRAKAAAWSALRDTESACSAAGSAKAAAWSTERKWQEKELNKIITSVLAI